MNWDGITWETFEPIEKVKIYLDLRNEFEKEIQRPMTEKEKAFLQWLAHEHLKEISSQN